VFQFLKHLIWILEHVRLDLFFALHYPRHQRRIAIMRSGIFLLIGCICAPAMGFAGHLTCKSERNEPSISNLEINISAPEKKAWGSLTLTEYSGMSEGKYKFGTYDSDVIKVNNKTFFSPNSDDAYFQGWLSDEARFTFTLVDDSGNYASVVVTTDGDPILEFLTCNYNH